MKHKKILLPAALAVLVPFAGMTGCSEKSSSSKVELSGFELQVSHEPAEFEKASIFPYEDESSEEENKSVLVQSNKSNGEFTYDVYSDHLELKQYNGTSVKVVVPDEIDGLPLTKLIGKDNVMYKTEVQIFPDSVVAVQLPDTITEIGNCVFYYNSSLKSINIPDSVEYIGDYSFYGCSNLDGIKLPKSLKYLGESVFKLSSSKTFGEKLVIPDGVTEIKDSAFYIGDYSYSEGLKEVYIPDSVRSIGNEAFCGYVSIEKIVLGNGITEIGKNAFERCISLKEIIIPESVNSIGEYAFTSCNALSSVELPDSITELPDNVFSGCKSLKTLKFPNTIKIINYGAFSESGLESFDIPEGVTLCSDCFSFCKNLKSVVVPKGTIFEENGDEFFYGCESLEKVTICSERIPSRSFPGCYNIEEIILSDDVISIEASAFEIGFDANKKCSIHIPESVISINKDCFYGKAEKITVYGKKGSEAEKFAKEKGIKFIEE